MENQAAQIQKKLQIELDSFKASQKDYSKMVQQRQLLDGQLNENKSVLEELNKLSEDKNTVYKLMGPILVKQSLTDSQQNITKRIDFISNELQKCNDFLQNVESQQDKHRENLGQLQQQLQVLQAIK
ncbi:unnamed protein product [Diamesa serratosioi]